MYFLCNEYRMKNFERICAQQLAGKNPPTKAHYMQCELKKPKYMKNCRFDINEYIYIPYFVGIDSTLIDRYNILRARKFTHYYDNKRDRRNYIEIINEDDEDDDELNEEDIDMEQEEEIMKLEEIFKDDRPVFDYLKYQQILDIYEEKQLEYYDLSINLLKELDIFIDNLAIDDIVYIKNSKKVLNKFDLMKYRIVISDELQKEIDRLNKIITKLDENKPKTKKKFFNFKVTIIIIIIFVLFIIWTNLKKKNKY